MYSGVALSLDNLQTCLEHTCCSTFKSLLIVVMLLLLAWLAISLLGRDEKIYKNFAHCFGILMKITIGQAIFMTAILQNIRILLINSIFGHLTDLNVLVGKF